MRYYDLKATDRKPQKEHYHLPQSIHQAERERKGVEERIGKV